MKSNARHASGPVRPFLRATAWMLALLILAGISLQAGEKPKPRFAIIFGTVWNKQERAQPGVTVKIRRADDKAGKVRWELVSDARGEFAQRVPAEKAEYIVWAELKGRKGPAAETKVQVEYDEQQDIGLHLTE